jgi:uncharacterized membrane protein YgdD (TMEM256/DUF423 family)
MTRLRSMRFLAAAGAVLAACSVALSAYAAHAGSGGARERLYLAAVFAFGHGLALTTQATAVQPRLARYALGGLLLGTLLFAGSLAAGATFGTPTSLAPFGGLLLVASWLALAFDRSRR